MMRLGVCSWSLGVDSPDSLVESMRAVGLTCVQLALDPIREGTWSEAETVRALIEADITIVSGMMAMAGEDYSTLEAIARTGGVRPDATWEANLAATKANAEIAARLQLPLVTYHAGFLAEEPDDPERLRTLDRMRTIADIYAEKDIALALETGQESAPTLIGVLEQLDRPTGVNFDPANMILYGMGDPIDSLEMLAPWVRQIHIKEAKHTETPGTWGTEVPAGEGDVDWNALANVVRTKGLDVDLVIEREAGDSRIADIRKAAQLVKDVGMTD